MLTPCTISTQSDADKLISKIAGMMTRGEIKIIKGSLYSATIDMEFKVKGTPDRWLLRGVNDNHGGLTLYKI
jgi:hypothetical protein